MPTMPHNRVNNIAKAIKTAATPAPEPTANPNRIVRDDSVGRSWLDEVPGERERRAAIARHFVNVTVTTDERHDVTATTIKEHEGGLEEMLARGLVEIDPLGDRCTLRGIMPEDAAGSGANVKQPDYDGRKAAIHELVAIGPGAEAEFRAKGHTDADMPKVGELFFVLSTFTDRLSASNKKVRLVTVPARYLGARVRIVKRDEPAT